MRNVSEPSSINSTREVTIELHETSDVAKEISSPAPINPGRTNLRFLQFSLSPIMSTELQKDRTLRDPKISTMPPTKASTQDSGEASSSIRTEKSLTPTKLPKAETCHPSITTEVPRESLLAMSFRKLGSMLRLSLISKSFRSKSNFADMRKEGNEGWSDIVDNLIESDNESESLDSYVEFMNGHGNGRKGYFNAPGKTLRHGRKKTDTGNEEERKDEGNVKGLDVSVPWFEESCYRKGKILFTPSVKEA